MTTMDKRLHLDVLEKVTGGAQTPAEQPEVKDGKVVTPKEKKRRKINIPKPTN